MYFMLLKIQCLSVSPSNARGFSPRLNLILYLHANTYPYKYTYIYTYAYTYIHPQAYEYILYQRKEIVSWYNFSIAKFQSVCPSMAFLEPFIYFFFIRDKPLR